MWTVLLGCSACAPDAVLRSERLAAAAGAERQVLTGAGFRHVAFSRGLSADVRRLHVYIGGDGRAFADRYTVARDPTPARPVALRLMLADATPAIYIARPCYHGTLAGDDCHPGRWTLGRYSEAVVASTAAVVAALAASHPAASLTLIGYSGGGVIALLAAARLAQVDAVVTLAAPLDVAAWTAAHGYTPLRDSLDPARRATWPPQLRQLHLHGGRDRNVAPAMVRDFRLRLHAAGHSAVFRVIDEFDHECCWIDAWPDLLAELEAAAALGNAGRETLSSEYTTGIGMP